VNVRRDRGVALPSPVAALSILAIVAAAIAFAVTGFGGSKNKDVTPPSAAPSVSISTTPTASAAPTKTAPVTPAFDKSKIHVSFYNNGTVKGLAKDVAATATAAGWTNTGVGTRPLSGPYTENAIYYPAQFAAAAKQLALDLGITKLSTGDTNVGDRIVVVLITRPN
jgi:hypothetical protein